MDGLPYEKRKLENIPCVTVACCGDCNCALGNKRIHTIDERLIYLETYYENLFNKKYAMWTEEEINELGYSLQNSVRAKQEKLGRCRDKIRGIQKRFLLVETHPTFESDEKQEKKRGRNAI